MHAGNRVGMRISFSCTPRPLRSPGIRRDLSSKAQFGSNFGAIENVSSRKFLVF